MYLSFASVLRTPAASSYSMGTTSSHRLTGWMVSGSPFIVLSQPANGPHTPATSRLPSMHLLHLTPRLVLGIKVGVVAQRLAA